MTKVRLLHPVLRFPVLYGASLPLLVAVFAFVLNGAGLI